VQAATEPLVIIAQVVGLEPVWVRSAGYFTMAYSFAIFSIAANTPSLASFVVIGTRLNANIDVSWPTSEVSELNCCLCSSSSFRTAEIETASCSRNTLLHFTHMVALGSFGHLQRGHMIILGSASGFCKPAFSSKAFLTVSPERWT